MSGESQQPRSGDTVPSRAAASYKKTPGACGQCRTRKVRCDLNTSSVIHDGHPCKQCFSRGESQKCSFTEADSTFVRVRNAENVVPQHENRSDAYIWQNPVQAEVAALHYTVGELQDRVWRTEIQLAAAGSGQSSGSGDTTSNGRVERALEDMVALVTQKYTELEKENRRLSAQVVDLQKQMQAQGHVKLHEALVMSSALQNGYNGHPGMHLKPVNDGMGMEQFGAVPPRSVTVQTLQPEQTNKRSAEDDGMKPTKRNCVSNACLPCKSRHKKCDGVTSGCAGCAIYGTECVYDLSLDQRRKETVAAVRSVHDNETAQH